MQICELCGSANNEADESCRVCGQALKSEAQVQTPAAASRPSHFAPPAWPAQPPHAPAPAERPQHTGLQMSAVKRAPQTGVPPMMSDRREPDSVPTEPESVPIPGFMQSARSAAPQQEPVQLISANDLPDWIKQIAAEDEARAAADAASAPNPADQVDTIARQQLPGEMNVAKPPTTWLSKSGTAPEATEHWSAPEVSAATWGGPGRNDASARLAQEPVASSAPVFVPSPSEAYSYSEPKKNWLSKPSSPAAPSSATPVYRKRSIQLLAFAVLLLLLAAVILS